MPICISFYAIFINETSDRISVKFHSDMRLEIFTAVKIQFSVFWVATPCSDMVGYLKMRVTWSSEKLVFYRVPL